MIQDPKLKIADFGGLNTQSPKGVTLQPCVLENVWLDHKGGYSPMAAASPRLSQTILSAVHTGLGERLFIRTATDWGQFKNAVYSVLGGVIPDLTPAFTLSPGLILLPGPGVGENTYFSFQGYIRSYITSFLPYWDGTGTQPLGPHYYLQGVFVSGAGPTVTIGTSVYFRMPYPFKVFVGAYRFNGLDSGGVQQYCNIDGFQILDLNPTVSPPPVSSNWVSGSNCFRVVFSNLRVPQVIDGVSTMLALELFHNAIAGQTSYVLRNSSNSLNDVWSIPAQTDYPVRPAATLDRYYKIDLLPRTGVYHNARAWVAPSSIRQFSVQNLFNVVLTETQLAPNTLVYSEVYYASRDTDPFVVTPLWRVENSIAIPFKVSEKVVSLASLGRYLYILGDQEVFLLTGSSEADFYVECIADSIGCLSSASTQRLYNRLFWLSSGGVQMAQGGQVTEISGDIRDLVRSLNLATLSSTVDYVRALYYLSDGTLTLCFDARTGGWSTRTADGANQKLIFGGGSPFSLAGGQLSTLNTLLTYLGVRPGWKTGRVEWQGIDLGDLWNDRGFYGLSVGVDSDATGTLVDLSEVPGVTPQAQAQTFTSGVTAFRYRWKGYKAQQIKLVLTLTPDLGTNRCLLRPPLSVLVSDERESRT